MIWGWGTREGMTAVSAAAATAGTRQGDGLPHHDRGEDASHLLMHCLNQRHDSLLCRHFLIYCELVKGTATGGRCGGGGRQWRRQAGGGGGPAALYM